MPCPDAQGESTELNMVDNQIVTRYFDIPIEIPDRGTESALFTNPIDSQLEKQIF